MSGRAGLSLLSARGAARIGAPWMWGSVAAMLLLMIVQTSSGPARAAPSSPAPSSPAATIMPLGDSITYGQSAPQTSTPGGYRGYLAQDLSGAGTAWSYVGSSEDNPPLGAEALRYRHEGHPGYRVDQVAAGLDGPDAAPGAAGGDWLTGNGVHPGARPHVVVLHIGTNDVAQAFDPQGRYPGGYNGSDPSERAEFVDHLADRLQALLGKIERLDPGARIVVCTIGPMRDTFPDPTARSYDDAIRFRVVPLERALGVRVVLADVEAAFLSGPGGYHEYIGPDGVHPTPLGYRTMADTVAPAVRAMLNRA